MSVKSLAIFALICSSCYGTSMWVDDASGNIGTVNLTTGAVHIIGNAGVVLTDIAFSPGGALYGISFNTLYSVNSSTGAATAIGALGATGDANALVFSSTGTLYTADLSGYFYTVNASTGAATLVGSLGHQFASGGDLAFIGGNLYLATSSADLVKVNPATGAATRIGPFGVSSVFGLGTPDRSTLYAVANENVYMVNLSSGAATFDTTWAGNTQGFGDANGEAFITEAGPPPSTTTPEPANLALLGLGTVLVAVRLLRKGARTKAA